MAAGQGRLLVMERAGDTQEVPVAFGLSIGGGQPVLVARAPAGADPEHVRALARAGAHLVRVQPGSGLMNPYGEGGLTAADRAGLAAMQATGVPILAEVEHAADAADLAGLSCGLVVPGRQMQNFALLKRLGRLDCLVFLERGPACTVEEWLMAAEYVLSGGNRCVALVAGPSRGADGAGGGELDLAGALAARSRTHLPVLAEAGSDPATAGGIAAAVLAAGLHGLELDGGDPANLQALAGPLALTPAPGADLTVLRMMIESADADLVAVLQRRLQVAAAIGRVKRAAGLPIYQPRQERRVLERVLARSAGWLGADLVELIWGAIIRRSRDLQSRADVGPGTGPRVATAGD